MSNMADTGDDPFSIPDDSFDKEVLQHDGLVLVDFSAPWCGPCRQMAKILPDVDSALPDVKICKLNIDGSGDPSASLAVRYNVRSIPTVVLFSAGQELARHTGQMSAEQLQKFIEDSGKNVA